MSQNSWAPPSLYNGPPTVQALGFRVYQLLSGPDSEDSVRLAWANGWRLLERRNKDMCK